MILDSNPALGSSVPVNGLNEHDSAIVQQMLAQWARHRQGNQRRQQYYDQKNLFRDFRISTPPELANLEATLGWAAKVVDAPADRITFERFVAPGEDENPFELNDIVADNDFQVEFSQAVTSSMIHSCAFLTATTNDDGSVSWNTRSAEQATGLWDRRRRGLSAGLTVTLDEEGRLEQGHVYFRDRTIELLPSKTGVRAFAYPNTTGRLPMEVLRVKPDLKRPFGRSRITPAVMYFTDGGVRTVVRSEVGAEFFAAPQRYGAGIDPEAFDVNRWTAVTGRFLTIGKDEDGDTPSLGQFPQHSMQPHTDHLRMWAAQLSGESSIPINELGFVSDNPSSDPAIQSQRDPLRLIANKAIVGYRSALRSLAVTSVMLREGMTEEPEELKRVSAWFAPTFQLSDAAAADAVVKHASILPWLAESPVILEKLNYSQPEIERLLADKRRYGSTADLLAQVRSAPSAAEPVEADDGALKQAQVLKAKADALGVLRRAGVDADDAARIVELEGVKFIPGNPITIKTADE